MPKIILPVLHLNTEYLKQSYKESAIILILSSILDFNKITNIVYILQAAK